MTGIIHSKKIMLTVNEDVFEFLMERAHERGLTFQEYLRVVLGEWFLVNGGGRRKLKLESEPEPFIRRS
jgi:hypothetical protein